MDYKALGEYIENLRTTYPHIMSQQELANECGLSAGYISEIINGKRKPSLEAIDAIARVFRLRAGDVLVRAGWTSDASLTWECDTLVRVICREGKLTLVEVAETSL